MGPDKFKHGLNQPLVGKHKHKMKRSILQTPLFLGWQRVFTIQEVSKTEPVEIAPSFRTGCTNRRILLLPAFSTVPQESSYRIRDSLLHCSKHPGELFLMFSYMITRLKRLEEPNHAQPSALSQSSMDKVTSDCCFLRHIPCVMISSFPSQDFQ